MMKSGVRKRFLSDLIPAFLCIAGISANIFVYRQDRLPAFQRYAGEPPQTLLDQIYAAVRRFSGKAGYRDDITAVAVKIKSVDGKDGGPS